LIDIFISRLLSLFATLVSLAISSDFQISIVSRILRHWLILMPLFAAVFFAITGFAIFSLLAGFLSLSPFQPDYDIFFSPFRCRHFFTLAAVFRHIISAIFNIFASSLLSPPVFTLLFAFRHYLADRHYRFASVRRYYAIID